MTNSIVSYDLTNLMVPAFGQVRMVKFDFNEDNGYELEVNTIVLESVAFRPQSVTLDCSNVAENDFVEFNIRQINFSKKIKGGNTVTFNFPSINNMVFEIATPNNEEVRGFFYNFPSFPDADLLATSGGGGAVQDVNIVSSITLPVSGGGGGGGGSTILPGSANINLFSMEFIGLTGQVVVAPAGTFPTGATIYEIELTAFYDAMPNIADIVEMGIAVGASALVKSSINEIISIGSGAIVKSKISTPFMLSNTENLYVKFGASTADNANIKLVFVQN